MSALLYVLSALSSLTNIDVPAGTQLHIRLTSAVGSYASRPGSPVRAVLIAPVALKNSTVLPSGSALSGVVKSVRRVGFGLVHESAAMELQFTSLHMPDGSTLPLGARVIQVDNGRERVNRKGLIQEVRSTGSLTYRGCGYIKTALLWHFHAQLAFWAIKTLVVEVPEPEIYFPPGVELTLASTAPLQVPATADPADTPPLDGRERDDIGDLVAALPDRTLTVADSRPSDIVNAVFIGSRPQLAQAFQAAGWTEARPTSFRSKFTGFKAVAEGIGFLAAPMSPQLINQAEADMSWQKGLNDLSKRDHIRLWKQSGEWQGREVWVGAATRDIDFAYLRRGRSFTHRIEENVDQEREKVVHDLAFTSCVERVDWIDRPGYPNAARNATGDAISTDGRLALVRLNDCAQPRLSTETTDRIPVPRRGRGLQRFARREILSMRSDLFRANPYFRTYEGVRAVVKVIRRNRPTLDARTAVVPRASS